MDRCLARLVRDKYLIKIGKRASLSHGGTAPAVYHLGSKGWWYLKKTGRYAGSQAVSEHSLKIADLFTALIRLDREGVINLNELELEYPVGRARADLYVDLGVPTLRERRRFYVEVQLAIRKDTLRSKVDAYWRAYNEADSDYWPYVVFVVFDPWHQSEITKLIPDKAKELVQVYMFGELISRFMS